MPSSWERLGLSAEEWRDCQLAAIEMSVAAGARVPPGAGEASEDAGASANALSAEEVAVEFVLARAFDQAAGARSRRR